MSSWAPDWTQVACPQCSCDRLASPWGEPLRHGWPLICGACGAIAVFHIDTDLERWRIRRPGPDEALQLRKDEQVTAWLAEYDRDTLRRATAGRPKRTPPQQITVLDDGVVVAFSMGPPKPRPGRR